MRRHWYLLVTAAALGCAGDDIHYNPTPQLLPQNVRRIALHPIINKTGQFGLEDKLMLTVRDEFLRDGRYPLVPETDADGVVWTTISRYINTPIQYDANLVPTAYKLRVLTDLQFVDRKKPDQALWVERNIDEVFTYSAPTLAGGLTEEQAREQIWTTLAKDIVKRVIDGFGSVTGTSRRVIQGDAPSTEPLAAPETPLTPVNPHAY
ncbi:MAG: LPS assembly lipoprotein LptE [Elusimicrobia bacterium]|nr:LPS assembly lipoprotein LptE [Elusimicrobiota bacterium]